jgi:hypothetical protein
MLITHHRDRPGMIGRIGETLGAADVNISAMHVGRSAPRADALMILALDDDQSGSDMFLKTDYDPAVFKKLSPPRDFLETARAVLQNGFPEMQMPGAGEYMDALQGQLHAYLTGSESDPAKALQKAFFDVVTGKDRKHKHWLTPVPMKKAKK